MLNLCLKQVWQSYELCCRSSSDNIQEFNPDDFLEYLTPEVNERYAQFNECKYDNNFIVYIIYCTQHSSIPQVKPK